VLAAHCAAIGRPRDAIEKTVSTRFDPAEPTDGFVRRCAALGELGIEHAVVLTTGPWTPAAVAALAAAQPAVREL
jgi:hypothetical protein